MPGENDALFSRYERLLDEMSRIEKEWFALLGVALSPSKTDRLVFDRPAFEMLTARMETLDEELVEIELLLPDTPPVDPENGQAQLTPRRSA